MQVVEGGRREGSGAPPVTQSAMMGWGQQGEYGNSANGFRREGGRAAPVRQGTARAQSMNKNNAQSGFRVQRGKGVSWQG